MNSTPSTTESPLRLVQIGIVSLDDSLRIQGVDDAARVLIASTGRAPLEGRWLGDVVVPERDPDAAALRSSTATKYVGTVAANNTQLLVMLSHAGAQRVATLTSVNEYLIESQALARVQLRNTVESIIAGFAHEVRNPLASILSLTEAALVQSPSPESELVRIPGLVARVESLIQNSLAYSRPKSPKRELHRPGFLIDRASALLRPRDQASRVELPDDDEKVSAVMVDVLHAEQILVNLLENALDVSQSVVKVRLRNGGTASPSVCIEVADDGPGVSAEVAPRIFDPFFTTKAHGTGLGLAIARDLARLNGGDLRLATIAPRGAAFCLYLPSTPASVRGSW